jgi:hypothetical protein
MRMSLEIFRIKVGLSGQPFQWDFSKFQQLATDCSIKHWWQYANENHIHIEGPTPAMEHRELDVFLMDRFSQQFEGKDLHQVNQCRLYVQALTLSDITSIDGRCIEQDAWKGIHGEIQADWPNQGNPAGSAWRKWRQAVVICFCGLFPGAELPGRTPQLERPLGEWYEKPQTE